MHEISVQGAIITLKHWNICDIFLSKADDAYNIHISYTIDSASTEVVKPFLIPLC